MARKTPSANKWHPTETDFMEGETRPLLPPHTPVSHNPAPQVVSRKECTEPPVDHGIVAWLQVLGGWILFVNSWGLPNSFGVFQSFYLNDLLSNQSASAISWIGSIQLFLTTLGCLPGGLLLDRGHLRSLIIIGTLFEVAGLGLTSFSTKYWQVFLAQGLCMGVGSGILGLIPVAAIAMWFHEKRMLATGLAATGASFAGIVYPLMMRTLFSSISFPWATRMLALVILLSNAIPLATVRLRQTGQKSESSFNLSHFKDKPYTIFIFAFTLIMAAVFVSFFYIQEYALELSVPESQAFNLLAIINASNFVGRFAPNFIADRYGGINTLLPLTLSCIIVLAFIPLTHTLPSLIAISTVYGFLSGGVIVLPAPIIANLSPNPSEIGTRMGMAYLVAAFGGLVGTPISGAMKSGTENGKGGAEKEFRGVWWISAVILGLGFVALIGARVARMGGMLVKGRV